MTLPPALLAALVAALPRCNKMQSTPYSSPIFVCSKPATQTNPNGDEVRCDEHATAAPHWTAWDYYKELPQAPVLRRIAARGKETKP